MQTVITLAVGVWFIIAFSIYRHDAKDPSKPPCKKPIGTFLLVSGISQLAFLVISLIATFCCGIGVKKTDGKKAKSGCGTILMTFLLCLFILFMFAWWIVGQAWTFSTSSSQCHEILYNTSFWYLIVTYILIGIAIIIAIVVSCMACCCARRNKMVSYA